MAGFLRDSSQSGIADGPWLLVDFLEHEMLEAALFRHDRVPGNVLHLANNRLTVEISKAHAFWRNYRQVAIGKEEQIASVVKNCGHIRGDKVLILTQADNGRRAIAHGDNLVRLVYRDHRQGEYTRKLDHSLAHRVFQRWPMPISGMHEVLLNHVRDNFCVGFGSKAMTFLGQFLL